jgi:hypothetical protein
MKQSVRLLLILFRAFPVQQDSRRQLTGIAPNNILSGEITINLQVQSQNSRDIFSRKPETRESSTGKERGRKGMNAYDYIIHANFLPLYC